MTSCGDDGITLRYVVPTGYRGVFIIQEDKASSVVLKKQSGVVEVHIPSNGHLRVHSAKYIGAWHNPEAIYDDGSKLAVQHRDRADIMLFSLGASYGGKWAYYVGSENRYRELLENWPEHPFREKEAGSDN